MNRENPFKGIGPVLIVFIGLPMLFVSLAGLEYVYSQHIPGHDEVSRSLIITYVGPKSSVEYDMHWSRKNMRETPQIYCEGEFEVDVVRELDGLEGDLEIVCTWDSKPDGSANH